MKLLITGGAGFIGSHFVEYILEKYADYRIVTLDALTYAGNVGNLGAAMANPRHAFVHGRIEDATLVDKLVPGADVIVNFAAESHVDRSIAEPAVFIQTNVAGTQVLLEAAHRHGTGLFFQVSTDEVYGDLPLNSKLKFSETSPLKPNSPYSASKAAADLLVSACFRTFNLPIVISRCCNNYGPRQHPEKFLPTVILNAREDKPIPIYGDGLYTRDWLHVRDHCRAIDLIMHRGKPGTIYNIGADNEWRNIDLARRVLQLLSKPERLIQFVKDRPGHDRRYAIDFTRLREELGWSPRVPWEEGLRETVEWYTRRRTN